MKKINGEIFIKRAKVIHSNKYNYLSVSITDSKKKVLIICPKHGDFWQAPYAHMKGQGCPKCARKKVGKSLVLGNLMFIYKAHNVHGNRYDYSKVNYKNTQSKVNIICDVHNNFWQRPAHHLKGSGCPKCSVEEGAHKRKGNKKTGLIRTIKEFIELANNTHNNSYDYSKTIYKGAHKKVIIICKIHGSFIQSPNNHLCGSACLKCSKEKTNNKAIKKYWESFMAGCVKIHGKYYDYSSAKYIDNKTKIKIMCPKHGFFEQTPSDHINKKAGCPKCSARKNGMRLRKDAACFIKEARKAHGTKYIYDRVQYSTSHRKVLIVCRNHGPFSQTPNHHLTGNGCPRCGHTTSRPSSMWLDKLGVPNELREKTIILPCGKRYRADAYNPERQIVYEFWGDFWHGNPNIYSLNDINPMTKTSFGLLYKKTVEKIDKLLNAGYNVTDVWEKDFKEKKDE